jgi:hypothetical protein
MKKRLNFWIEESELKALETYCKRFGRTKADVLRELIGNISTKNELNNENLNKISHSSRSTPIKKGLTKPEPVDPSKIRLVEGKGTKGKGGDPGGHYWHIYVSDTRAGFVFINWDDQKSFGGHASIQIKINIKQQNRGIGRVAYRLACEKSSYDTVFAHMRKSNPASRRAAELAGFQEFIGKNKIRQFCMVWRR